MLPEGLAPRRRAIEEVFVALEAMHGQIRWHWDEKTAPFEMAAGAILVQNTAWANVERALALLREAGALAPDAMAALPVPELERLVRPSGQYRQKARKLREFLDLCGAHGGFDTLLALPAPELRAALLGTWGIGPETADCIVLYCARQPAFVVDAYTARVFRRLGLGPEADSYDAWQQWFSEALPASAAAWGRYHALIVLHAKLLCRKRSPRCGACSLRSRCPAADPGSHEQAAPDEAASRVYHQGGGVRRA